jgi:hypothetical protein
MIVLPRDGSFALALLGSVRIHDPVFSFALGRINLALKRIVDLVSCNLVRVIQNFLFRFAARNSLGLSAIFSLLPRFASHLSNSSRGFLWRPERHIRHTSANYPIYVSSCFDIVFGSLAFLAVTRGGFWVPRDSARAAQIPASCLPLCLSFEFRITDSGVFLSERLDSGCTSGAKAHLMPPLLTPRFKTAAYKTARK